MNRRLSTFIFLLPVMIIPAAFIYRAESWWDYVNLMQEDGPLENVQFLFFLLSGFLSIRMSAKTFQEKEKLRSMIYLILAATLLFISLEEISWGQRIFSINTPQFIRRINEQHEISLHNTKGLTFWRHSAYILIGLAGAFLWLLLPKRWLKFRLHECRPGSLFVFYFLPVAVLYGFLDYCSNPFITHFNFSLISWQDLELGEFLLSLGIFLFFLLRLKERPASPGVTLNWPIACLLFIFVAGSIAALFWAAPRTKLPYSFESPNLTGWSKKGSISFIDVSQEELLNTPHRELEGYQGNTVLSSLGTEHKNTGWARSPFFLINKPILNFLLAGGETSQRCSVTLRINDKTIRRTNVQETKIMKNIKWDLSEYLGQVAQIWISDHASSKSGYIIADNFSLITPGEK